MPEWLKGADCKSAGSAYVGSNPTRPTFFLFSPCSSAVEHTLGKGEVSGSSPDEGIAQNHVIQRISNNLESGGRSGTSLGIPLDLFSDYFKSISKDFGIPYYYFAPSLCC